MQGDGWLNLAKNIDMDPAYNLRNAADYHLVQPRTEAFKKITIICTSSCMECTVT
jgi:hypothetical protein